LSKLTELSTKAAQDQEAIGRLTEEAKQSARMLTAAEKREKELQGDLDAARGGEHMLQARIAQLEQENNANNVALAEANEDYIKKAAQIKKIRSELKMAKGDIADADATIVQMDKKDKKQVSEVAKLKRQLNDAQSKLDKISDNETKAKEKAREAVEKAKDELKRRQNSEGKLRQLERQLKEAKQKELVLQGEKAAYEAREKELKEERERLKRRAKQVITETAQAAGRVQVRLQDQIKKYQQAIERMKGNREVMAAQHLEAKSEKTKQEAVELKQATIEAVAPGLPQDEKKRLVHEASDQEYQDIINRYNMAEYMTAFLEREKKSFPQGSNFGRAWEWVSSQIVPAFTKRQDIDAEIGNGSLEQPTIVESFKSLFGSLMANSWLRNAGFHVQANNGVPTSMAAGGSEAASTGAGAFEKREAEAAAIEVSAGEGGDGKGKRKASQIEPGGGNSGDSGGGGRGNFTQDDNAVRAGEHSVAPVDMESAKHRELDTQQAEQELLYFAMNGTPMPQGHARDSLNMLRVGILEAGRKQGMVVDARKLLDEARGDQFKAKALMRKATTDVIERILTKDPASKQKYKENLAVRYLANLVLTATSTNKETDMDYKIFPDHLGDKPAPDMEDLRKITFDERVRLVRMALAYGTDDHVDRNLIREFKDQPPLPLFEELLQDRSQTRSMGLGPTEKSRSLHELMEKAMDRLQREGQRGLVAKWRHILNKLGWKLAGLQPSSKRQRRN